MLPTFVACTLYYSCFFPLIKLPFIGRDMKEIEFWQIKQTNRAWELAYFADYQDFMKRAMQSIFWLPTFVSDKHHFYTYAINQTRWLAGKKILLLSVLRARAAGRPVIECSFNLSKDEFPENTRFVSSFHSSAALWQAMQQIRDVFCCVLVRKLLELVPAYTTSLWVVKFKTG